MPSLALISGQALLYFPWTSPVCKAGSTDPNFQAKNVTGAQGKVTPHHPHHQKELALPLTEEALGSWLKSREQLVLLARPWLNWLISAADEARIPTTKSHAAGRRVPSKVPFIFGFR